MIEIYREPTHPGEVLKEDFLEPLGMTQSYLANAVGVSFRAINELVIGKRGMSTEMALRLAKYFKTSPQLWLNLQNQYDLYRVSRKKSDMLDSLKPCDKIVA